MNSKLDLRKDSAERYKNLVEDEESFASELHQPFREISGALLRDICELLSVDYDTLYIGFWKRRYTEPHKIMRQRPSRQLAMAVSFDLGHARVVIEFKRLDGDRRYAEFSEGRIYDDDTDTSHSSHSDS